MGKKRKMATDGGGALEQHPFAALSGEGLPAGKPVTPPAGKPAAAKPKKRGRVDVRREKGGRGGKVVTVISGEGLLHTGPQELESLAKTLKSRCGTGGAVKGKTVEIQGDKRDEVKTELENRGYRVVFTGG